MPRLAQPVTTIDPRSKTHVDIDTVQIELRPR
jgi:hypothetical protein